MTDDGKTLDELTSVFHLDIDLDEFKAALTAADFEELLLSKVAISTCLAYLEQIKKAIDGELMPQVLTHDETKLTDGGNMAFKHAKGTFAVMTRETKTVDSAMLIARGVDEDIVAECTRKSTSEPYLQFTAKRGGKGRQEEVEV